MKNFILDTDSYKTSHFLQYPPNTQYVNSYIESRGGKWDKTLFFGLQKYLIDLEEFVLTKEKIVEAAEVFNAHGTPFNEKGWLYILENHNGNLPIKIEAVSEGTVLPTNNVLVQIQNTDPECFWLTSYLETSLLRAVWYPTTVATLSYHIKQTIKKYLDETADNLDGLNFKLHDFGSRGVSSEESAMIGGMAHLVNFMGTDNVPALMGVRKYYSENMAGFSIPASEHSTITSWGKENEKSAYENMINKFGKGIYAVVSDSYDIYNAVSNIWGKELKQKIIDAGGTLVIRPDSGIPKDVVLKVITLLSESFGHTLNSKGYKLLPPYIRVIQGDGINEESIVEILENLKNNGFSADNIAFGMGGALLQQVNRDTLNFAMKTSAVCINNEWHDVFKQPIDMPMKASKKGILGLDLQNGVFETKRKEITENNQLETVYYKNKYNSYYRSFNSIKARSK